MKEENNSIYTAELCGKERRKLFFLFSYTQVKFAAIQLVPNGQAQSPALQLSVGRQV